jgi:hypothetical protein
MKAKLDIVVYGIAATNASLAVPEFLASCRNSGKIFSVAIVLFLVAVALTLVGWVRSPRRVKPFVLVLVATCANLICLH